MPSKSQLKAAAAERRRLNVLRKSLAASNGLKISDFWPKNIERTLKSHRVTFDKAHLELLPKRLRDLPPTEQLIPAAAIPHRDPKPPIHHRPPPRPDVDLLARLIVAVYLEVNRAR